MLDSWERGVARGMVDRGLILLALTDPEADEAALAALPIGARERRLLELRAAAFGPRLTGLVACEACGEQLELALGVDELCAAGAAGDADLTLVADGYALSLRLPDSADLRAAAAAPPDAAASLLLRRCVVRAERDGAPADPENLPAALLAAAGDRLADADPLADLRFALTCVGCGHVWQAPFDAAAFVWAELDAWAARMLREVHTLAAAYGWSERDILRLGAARRARYLDMVAG